MSTCITTITATLVYLTIEYINICGRVFVPRLNDVDFCPLSPLPNMHTTNITAHQGASRGYKRPTLPLLDLSSHEGVQAYTSTTKVYQ